MFIELMLAIIMGCILGTITGMIPGLHINLMSAIIFGFIPALSPFFSLDSLAVLIISMSITHSFVDFIPAIFLGAASEGTAFAAMPGNEFLLKGFGLDAIRLALIGCFFGLVAIVLLLPLFLIAVPLFYSAVKNHVGWILIFASAFLIFWKASFHDAFWNLFVFGFSGVLGIMVFNSNISEPLLPLLSGLFGISLLMVNFNRDVFVPTQHIVELISIKLGELSKAVSLGVFSGSIISIFPALGPAHSASIATRFFGKCESKVHLMLIGCISAVSMAMSLITLYSFGKARNGSVAIIGDFLGGLNFSVFLLLLASSIISGCIAVFIVLLLGRFFAYRIGKIGYGIVSFAVIAIISLFVLLFSGTLGLLVLVTSASIGIIPIVKNVNRSSAMGCLIIPVIIYYLT